MPTNAESFVGSYVSSLETFWNKEREEAKSLLMKEEGNRGAYIQMLEQSIRAADDDIRNWTSLEGQADRAERKLILERQRLSISKAKARRRGIRSGSVAGSAFDDLESKFAQKATGKGEKSLNLAQAATRSGGKSDEEAAKAIVLQLQNETDLSSLIAKTGVGITGTAGLENRVAAGSGMLRTLMERNARNRLGLSKQALQMAAATMVGLHGFDAQGRQIDSKSMLLGPEMVSKMRGAVTMRADKAVAAAPSGGEDKALADELQRSGFLLEDFLPAMEASGLIQRREDLERRLAEERAARVPDLEAETERRFLERVGTSGAGEGLEFAGRGIVGALQFASQERQQRRALDERKASLTTRQSSLDAMTPNARLLQRTTGLAMGSYQKHGNNVPPGVNPDLWNLASQIANQSKSGGFSSRDDIVVQARALVNQLESTKRMSPEERENALEQTLEFFGMQKMGDYPPPAPPVERVVDEVTQAVEDADPDAGRGNRSDAAKAAAEAKAKADADAKEKRDATQAQGLSRRDIKMLSRVGLKRALEFLDFPTTMRGRLTSRKTSAGYQHKRLDEHKKKNNEQAQRLRRSGVSPNIISSGTEAIKNMSLPDGKRPHKGLLERAARIEALSIVLDMIEQQQDSGTFSLSKHLRDNPKLSIELIGRDGAGQDETLMAAQAPSKTERELSLGVVDTFIPSPFVPQAEEQIMSTMNTEEEWDSLLDQMIASEDLAASEQASEKSLESALEGF